MSADTLPISKELMDILRCPLAVQDKTSYGDDPGRLELVHNSWLVSTDSGLKYPIRDGIPVMLIDEGMKWKETAVADLPVPPPASGPAAADDGGSSSVSASGGKSGGISTMILGALVLGLLAAVAVIFKRRG